MCMHSMNYINFKQFNIIANFIICCNYTEVRVPKRKSFGVKNFPILIGGIIILG